MPTLLILYNTKTGNTEQMAKAIEQGPKTYEENKSKNTVNTEYTEKTTK